MSTSHSLNARNWPSVAEEPLIQARLLPLASMVRRSSTVSAGLSKPWSASQVAALAPAKLALMTSAQIVALTTDQVTALTTAQVAALTNGQVAALTTAQAQAIETADLAAAMSVEALPEAG